MAKLSTIIEYSFYFFIFLLPWQTRLIWQDAYLNGFVWEYGRLSLYGIEILLWTILTLYLVWLFKNRTFKKIKFDNFFSRLKNPGILIYWLLILFLLVAGLSVVWSLNSQLAYYRFVVLFESVALLSMVLIFNFNYQKIATCWVASAAVQGVFAIWQFFNQYVFANKWLGLAEHYPTVGGSIILQTNSERWLRAYGSLPHPNIMAGFLVIGLLFLIYLSFNAKKLNQRIFLILSLLAIVPAIFFSFSRSSWVALFLTLAILGLWLLRYKNYLWRNNFFKLVLLITIIFVILAFNFQQPLLTRLTGEQDLEVASIYLRVAFTKQAIEIIKHYPWWGTGIGNYTLGVYQIVNGSWPGYYYQPVHNIYLLILAELGIFGFLIFLAVAGLFLWQFKKTAISLEKVIFFLAMVAILVISLFDHYFWTLNFGMLVFFLILGLNLKQIKRLDTT